MRMADLRVLGDEYVAINGYRCRERNVAPNRAFVSAQGENHERLILECKQSDNGPDFFLAEGIINVIEWEKEKPGRQGYVRLIDRNGNYVNHDTAENVWARVKRYNPIRPMRPHYAPYYIIDRDLKSKMWDCNDREAKAIF